MNKIITAFIYFSFTLLGYLPTSDACDDSCAMEVSCCNSEESSCGSDEPMDCCVDEIPDLPLYDQVLPLAMQVPIGNIQPAQETNLKNLQPSTFSLEPFVWHPPPEQQKVYIKFQRLLFYA